MYFHLVVGNLFYIIIYASKNLNFPSSKFWSKHYGSLAYWIVRLVGLVELADFFRFFFIDIFQLISIRSVSKFLIQKTHVGFI